MTVRIGKFTRVVIALGVVAGILLALRNQSEIKAEIKVRDI